MLPLNIDLQVERNPRRSVGFRSGAIRFGSNEIDDDVDFDLPDEVGEEQECAGGDADDNRRGGAVVEGNVDLRSELGDSFGDLFF